MIDLIANGKKLGGLYFFWQYDPLTPILKVGMSKTIEARLKQHKVELQDERFVGFVNFSDPEMAEKHFYSATETDRLRKNTNHENLYIGSTESLDRVILGLMSAAFMDSDFRHPTKRHVIIWRDWQKYVVKPQIVKIGIRLEKDLSKMHQLTFKSDKLASLIDRYGSDGD
ncbi:hypothetical protein [Marinobacter salsuginis]|uniref:Uncharacterized protein n=1 Tax=Marinobacter salsuginis TaxID=418719 RepID=A0A5M3Q1Z8_9GAMM|nr:hypothetical protein [Marinobacter salsuginis]GBO89146.1 hypothetical protein MSSD14B_28140 [Marinobacter salsuginis]